MVKKLLITLLLLMRFVGCEPAFGTVTATTTKRQYFVCNGSTTTFTFTMPVNSSDDIKVEKVLLSTGDPTTLVEDTDYTIAATDSDYLLGGVVTISPALATTYSVVIIRGIVLTQETSSGAVNAVSVEAALDKLTRALQDARNDIDGRAIRIPNSDPTTAWAELTDYVSRAGYWLGFDSSTGAPFAGTPAATGISVSAFMATVNDDASALLAMATLQGIPVINVTNAAYGVTGDGSDEITQIQAAADAAELVGGILYFPTPPTEYVISDRILIDTANVKVFGSGMNCNIRQTTWGKPVFEVRADDIWIDGFFLESTETKTTITSATYDSLAGGTRAYTAGIYTAAGDRYRFTNLKISGFVAGIYARGETDNSTLNEGGFIENIWVDTTDQGIAYRQQKGLIINNIWVSDIAVSQTNDASHAFYSQGVTIVLNQDCIINNITTWDNTGGHAFQVKFSERCTFNNLNAYAHDGLLVITNEVTDCTFTNLTGLGMTDTGGVNAIIHISGVTTRRNRISGVNIDNSTAGNVALAILDTSGTNDDNIIEDVLFTDSSNTNTACALLRGTRSIIRNFRINCTSTARKGITISDGSDCMVDGIASVNAAGSYFITVASDALGAKVYYDRNRIDLQSGNFISNSGQNTIFRDKAAGITEMAVSHENSIVFYENEMVVVERERGILN